MIYGPECTCGHVGPTITGYGPDDVGGVMAIGIAPGRQEIKGGRPFVGPAGKRFDEVLAACGYPRSQVYTTNLICWYKDDPTFDEIGVCWPRLLAEISERRPRLILALGALASEWLTGYKVSKVRGGIIAGDSLGPNAHLWEYPHKLITVAKSEYGTHLPDAVAVDGDQITAAMVAARLKGGTLSFADAIEEVIGTGALSIIKHASPNVHVMPTWHPAATLGGRNPALVADLVRDFQKIPRFLQGELAPITFRYRVIGNQQDAQQMLYWASSRELALDVETTFDTPEEWGRLLCLSVSTYLPPSPYAKEGSWEARGRFTSYVLPRGVLDDLDWPGSLRARGDRTRSDQTRWGFHNGPFDRNVLRRELGVDLPITWDSMYHSYGCDERPGYDRDDRAAQSTGAGRNKSIGPGYHNLDQLAREYTGAGFFKADTAATIGTDPDDFVDSSERQKRWDALHLRNALDAAYTVALPQRLPEPAPCYRTILLPAANAYADVTRTGIRIDVERLRFLEADWGRERSSMEKHLEEWAADLGYINPPKRKRDLEGEPFNPSSTQQLARLLFSPELLGIKSRVKTKKGKPSTSEEALAEIDHPFVEELMRLRKYVNTLKYLPIIRQNLRPDGRVHPTFLPLVTARYSAVDPPMQTFPQPYKLVADGVPELASLRSIIIPSEGMVLAAVDYEQLEIWVGALLSQDQMMLQDLTAPFEGGKPNYHSNVARNVLRCAEPIGSDVWEKVRRGAKVFTFGIEFGEGSDGLAKNASREMGQKMTPRVAQRIINDWYQRYATFAQWQREQVRTARRLGYIENPFGFRRRFPYPDDAFRNQMVNCAIQGTASQHGTIAMIELVDDDYFEVPFSTNSASNPWLTRSSEYPFQRSFCQPLSEVCGGNVLLTIHDEILTEIPEDRLDQGLQHIKEVMEFPRVPGWPGMKTESKVGWNWHEMHKDTR